MEDLPSERHPKGEEEMGGVRGERRAECGGGTWEVGEEGQGKGERRKELGGRGAGRGGGRKMGTAERWGSELGEKPIGEAGGGS